MCAESLSSGFPIRANPQENLKEIRNYLKIIVHECVHMCGHVCECAGVCMWRQLGIFILTFFIPARSH